MLEEEKNRICNRVAERTSGEVCRAAGTSESSPRALKVQSPYSSPREDPHAFTLASFICGPRVLHPDPYTAPLSTTLADSLPQAFRSISSAFRDLAPITETGSQELKQK